jgi:hypothetical protein
VGNARLWFDVFMLKSVPSGRRFESRAGQKISFQIKYTRDVKSMIRVVRRWSIRIYIDSTYQKRKICDMVFECIGVQKPEKILRILKFDEIWEPYKLGEIFCTPKKGFYYPKKKFVCLTRETQIVRRVWALLCPRS